MQANSIIENSALYNLSSDFKDIFLTNSSEAIWQLQQINNGITYNATPDGYLLIPRVLNSTYPPTFYLTNTILNSFDSGDLRKTEWIESTIYRGVKYYFPYKYKMGVSQTTVGGDYTEYYMVFRLAEQYLIRAEAEANGAAGGIPAAIDDINIIRHRANLSDYSGPSDKDSVLNAIMHENQIEFFSEWGHRWLDLKRLNKAVDIIHTNKNISISNNALLYPIPLNELISNPNLTQNPGYN
jgi:hypothetical protein